MVKPEAITQSVAGLQTAVTEVRKAAKAVDANSWGDGMNGADYEAGRAYLEQGKRIAAGLDRTVTWLKVWTTAAEAVAGAIGKATVEYTDVDGKNARDLNQVAAK
ncbi:hypothetical protein [Nocardia sp. NPDC058666]|uniref:hypothetical protein n=1 Tax=Nocardia sp. NPDC058666 TaxID=3346587 RepID=UPI003657EEB4